MRGRRWGGEDAHINLMNIHGDAELPSEVGSGVRVWGAVGERCRQRREQSSCLCILRMPDCRAKCKLVPFSLPPTPSLHPSPSSLLKPSLASSGAKPGSRALVANTTPNRVIPSAVLSAGREQTEGLWANLRLLHPPPSAPKFAWINPKDARGGAEVVCQRWGESRRN